MIESSENEVETLTGTGLLSLPVVVSRTILDRLDFPSLKRLRVVSKTTKEWVEEAKYLQKFTIHINSLEIQNELIQSTVPWNNFVVPITSELSPSFMNKFGQSIKHIQFNQEVACDIKSADSLNGIRMTTLVTLIIKILRVKSTEQDTSRIWIRDLVNMKTLHIESIYIPETIHTPDYPLFGFILKNCSNLRNLRLPRLRCGDTAAKEELVSKIIVEPLLNYLKRFEGSRTDLRITLSPYNCCEDFPCRHAEEYQLTPEGLLELVQVSSKIGATLYNVPSRAFPHKNKWLSRADRESFEKAIANITAVNSNSGLQNLYIPQSAKLNVEIHVKEADYTSFTLPEQLYSIHLDHRTLFIPFLQPLIYNLFQVHRPTVQELACVWSKWGDMRLVFTELWDAEVENIPTGLEICSNFPNLKKLHLECWNNTMTSDFNDLLNGFPLLEHLSLVNCGNFSDDGILGPDYTTSPLLQMKNLTYLDVSGTDITDDTFKNTFRNMRLKTFIVREYSDTSHVTFKDGISTLGTFEGVFGESIEEFEICKPNDCSKSDMTYFVETHFKNLRVFKLHGIQC